MPESPAILESYTRAFVDAEALERSISFYNPCYQVKTPCLAYPETSAMILTAAQERTAGVTQRCERPVCLTGGGLARP